MSLLLAPPAGPVPEVSDSSNREPDRPYEPCVPVYRYFLAGGAEQRQLPARSVAILMLASFLAIPVATALGSPEAALAITFSLAVSTAITSCMLAALITRWAGRPSGCAAGWLTTAVWMAAAFLGLSPGLLAGASTATGAILLYALAELPNRSRAIFGPSAAIAFYAIAAACCLVGGTDLLIAIAAVCLGTVLGNQNSRGIRFFLSPVGMAIIGGALGFTFLVAEAGVPAAQSTVPGFAAWSCLAAGAAASWPAIRSGHAASPLGRLLLSWLLAPAMLAGLGAVAADTAIAITVPAWTATAGLAALRLRRTRIRTIPS